jgi:hypothetical protein
VPEALIRHIVIIGIAAAITGIVIGGLGSRLVMFFSRVFAVDTAIGRLTENGNRIGEFTVGGTLGLVIFVGIFAGLITAPMYFVAEPWIAWARGGRGLLFGLLLLAVGGTPLFAPGSLDFIIVGRQALNVAMFVGLFLVFGAVVAWLVSRLGRRLPPASGTAPAATYIGLAILGGILVFFVLLGIASNDCEACPPGAPWLAILVGLMAVATFGWWYVRINPGASSRVDTTVIYLGHGAFALILIGGGVRLLQNILKLLP